MARRKTPRTRRSSHSNRLGRAVADETTVTSFYEAVAHFRHPVVIFDRQEFLVAYNSAYSALHCDAAGACILRKGMHFHEIAEWRLKNGFYIQDAKGAAVGKAGLVRHSQAKGTLPYQLRDGRWMYVDTYRAPDGSNMGIWLDITALKAAEQQKLALEAQLNHAQRLDSLGRLAGGLAHDLNNALVPVLALTKRTLGQLGPESREGRSLAIVLQGAQRAAELVRQILAFSRKDAPTRQIVQPSALVRSSLPMLRAGLPSTVSLVDAIADAPPVFADPRQLEQVLANLVVNAAQAIGKGIGAITIALAHETATLAADQGANPVVKLSVSDTGCGMDSATRKQIFEPFFTTKGVGEGTGLGLSIVHGIVTCHGGRIEVTSEPGVGTRFDVLLPIAPAELLEASPNRPIALPAA
jgi:signal transduction histidine kinase